MRTRGTEGTRGMGAELKKNSEHINKHLSNTFHIQTPVELRRKRDPDEWGSAICLDSNTLPQSDVFPEEALQVRRCDVPTHPTHPTAPSLLSKTNTKELSNYTQTPSLSHLLSAETQRETRGDTKRRGEKCRETRREIQRDINR